MQEPRREPSSYFSFSPWRHESASSTPVSPGASIERTSPLTQCNPHLRPSSAPRATSDYTTTHPRVKVQTIEEDAVHSGNASEQVRTPRRSQAARWSSEIRASMASTRNSAPTSTHSTPVALRSTPDTVEFPNPRRSSVAEPPYRPRPGHRWSRTKSGSVWYERLKSSSGRSKDSSSPSQASNVPKRLIIPLTPPTPSKAREAPYRHQVKVEKSFTILRPEKKIEPKSQHSHTMPSPESRRSSINPLRLFSAPLQLVRKVSLSRPKLRRKGQNTSPTRKVPIARGAEMRGHKSLLKRIHTSEALRQVTSILHESAPQSGACSPVTVVKPLDLRQRSEKSSSSKGSKHKIYQMKASKGLISHAPAISRRSTHDLLDPVHSYSTSQLEFRMGAQPANTPDEKATYRVKRSPSAESEEFLKVDISIRGGTSYLPSEARRIHTPPLPNEGPGGKRRGFFFDYTAPRSDQSRQASATPSSPPRLELPSDFGFVPRRSTSKASTVHKHTFSLRTEKSDKKATRSKTCDWYDAKLTELDSTEDEREHPERPTLGRARSATTKSGTSLAEFKKKREEMFDYSIPEHLPSSPLCPRHSRYWRVVQGRGSRFRGCWMHGVGVYAEGEARVAGKVVI